MMFLQRTVSKRLLRLLLLTACIAGARTGAGAQSPATAPPMPPTAASALTAEEVRTRLQKPVHLIRGAVTLPQLAADLSAQSGLQIQPADYLRERRLVVQLDNVSAGAALNALAELNDWSWNDKGGGQIVIARRLPLLRAEPQTIPLRARAALPKDIRAFCRIGPVYDHPPQPADKNAAERENTVPSNARPQQLASSLRRKLADSLNPGILNGAEYPWSRLTLQQQQDMTTILLFDTLWLTNMKLYGDPLPYLADPMRAFLEMQGSSLSIMTRPSPNMRSGFGSQITPRTEEQ